MIQVAMMAARGRPRIMAACLERLVGAGRLFAAPLARLPRIYFAGDPPAEIRALERFEVTEIEHGRPYLPHFWRMLTDATPTADLLLLENDVWIVKDGVPRIAALEAPRWAGVVSLFDFRNETPREQYWPMPWGRAFWGNQALLIPARVLPWLCGIARAGIDYRDPNSTDGWLGRAVEQLGLRVALHSPSLVQHLGTRQSEISPSDHDRPAARNFPEPWPSVHEINADARGALAFLRKV